MINVSEAWKDVQQRFILPESHIEIDCTITEAGIQDQLTITGTNEAFITITSAYRTPPHNSKEGAAYSQHLYGKTADMKVSGVSPKKVAQYAETLLDNGGIGTYSTFTHIDVRTTRSRWNG
jgi:uncharacterized protein YcbK (DUF882 family)